MVAGAALLQADPLAAGKSAIFVAGTSADDVISIKPGTPGMVNVTINNKGGSYSGNFSLTGVARIVVYSGAGNDNVAVDRKITLPAWVFAGGGDDHVLGGGGNDVLVGGGGRVDLQSGPGRSLLIGGSGPAHLKSGGEDILIAGSTRYDNSFAGLGAIMAEWTRTDANYLTRTAHLVLGIPKGGLNGSTLLNNSTITTSRHAAGTLEGGAGNDLFFAQLFGNRKRAADRITGWRWARSSSRSSDAGNPAPRHDPSIPHPARRTFRRAGSFLWPLPDRAKCAKTPRLPGKTESELFSWLRLGILRLCPRRGVQFGRMALDRPKRSERITS